MNEIMSKYSVSSPVLTRFTTKNRLFQEKYSAYGEEGRKSEGEACLEL